MEQHVESYDATVAATGLYLCHLVARALRGGRAADDSKPVGVTWTGVYALAKRNSIEAIVWMGVPEHPSDPIPDNVRTAWSQAADLTLFRQLNFDAARESIGRELGEHGISFMALKGVHTSAYYPQPGMRSMADNDLLYGMIERSSAPHNELAVMRTAAEYHVKGNSDAERATTIDEASRIVREIMPTLGYSLVEETNGDLSYVQKPYLSFELVSNVVMPRNAHYQYYRNPWLHTVPVDPQSFAAHGCGEMRWPTEDEYLFHLSHMFKHYDQFGGCGIRFAIDEWVFLEEMRKQHADWQYVHDELAKMDLTDFERRVRRVAMIACGVDSLNNRLTMDAVRDGSVTVSADDGMASISQPAVDGGLPSHSIAEDWDFLYFLLTCGTYGNLQFQIKHNLAKAQKASSGKGGSARYIWQRIFPSRALLVSTYPWLERRLWLIPFMPFYRLARGLTHNGGKILTELRYLFRRR